MTDPNFRNLIAAYREEHSIELDAVRLQRRISRSLSQSAENRRSWSWRLGLIAACIGCASVAGASPALSVFHWLKSEVLGLGVSDVSETASAESVIRGLPKLNQPKSNPMPSSFELTGRVVDVASGPTKDLTRRDAALERPSQVSSSDVSVRRAAAAKAVSRAKSDGRSQRDPADALRISRFERAYNYQFHNKQYATALHAWDQLLEAEASDTLSVDARFYRAVCLLQLGQRTEAERVLRAFAAGQYGAGRRERALTLLRALAAP